VLLLLIPHGLRQSLGERKRQRDGMFGNDRPVDVARVGHDDIAGQQYRRHEVMDRRSRRMNPAQSLCRRDLLPAQRPCDRDVSIRDFLDHMIVVGQMYHFELRKIVTQPLREPRRNLPERKAVMESDEKLHEDSFEFRVSSFKLKTGINPSSPRPSPADRAPSFPWVERYRESRA